MLNYKQYEGKKTLYAGGKVILTRHNGVKNLRTLLSTNRPTQADQLVTCRVDGLMGVIAGSAEKWSKTKQWN